MIKRLTINKQRKQSISLHRTIETLPVWNWEQVKKTGDYRYLLKLEDYDDLPEIEMTGEHWLTLQDEFSQRCGVTDRGSHYMDKFIELQRLIRDEIVYSCDEYNPKLSKTKAKRKILERELEDVPKVEQTLEDQAIQLEIFFQREFDVRKMSVLIWNKYLQEYERRIEELQNRKRSNQKQA